VISSFSSDNYDVFLCDMKCIIVNLKCEIILLNHDKSQHMVNFCDVD
jgi:hypothetical protein